MCVVGAMLTIGYETSLQSTSFDITTHVLESWYFRGFDFADRGITTSLSLAMKTSPGEIESRDAPAAMSSSFKLIERLLARLVAKGPPAFQNFDLLGRAPCGVAGDGAVHTLRPFAQLLNPGF